MHYAVQECKSVIAYSEGLDSNQFIELMEAMITCREDGLEAASPDCPSPFLPFCLATGLQAPRGSPSAGQACETCIMSGITIGGRSVLNERPGN